MSGLVGFWRRLPAVSAKFLIILIPVLVVSTAAFSGLIFYRKYFNLRTNLEAKILAVADSNAAALSINLWAFDIRSARQIIKAIAVNDEIKCIEVVDRLVSTSYTFPEPNCDQFHSLSAVTRPILVEDKALGDITLYYDFDSIDRLIWQDVGNSFWQLLLILGGAVVAALLAHRLSIGLALDGLITSIRIAEQEHRRQPVEWSTADELGQVIAAYNRMQVKLTDEEQRLRRSEERLSLAISATRCSVWDLDLRHGEYWWSPEFPAMLGFEPNELAMSRQTWESLIHPEELAHVGAACLRHIDGRTDAFHMIYRMRRRDGNWMWVEDKATAVRDGSGQAVRLTGVVADVNERIQAESDLARERAILQATLENVDQGIVMYDRDLRLVMFNRRAAELLNVPLKFLVQRPTFPDVLQCQIERGEYADYGEDPYRHLEPWHSNPAEFGTFKRRRSDGTIIEVRSNPLFQGGFVCTYADVTAEARSAEEIFVAMQETERALEELKETQANLVQAEKMSSLGLLVAGIAHEINTPVGIAFGCAGHLANRTQKLVETLESGALKRSDLKAYVGVAAESSRLMLANLTRAADLIQSFKQVAVDQTSGERRRFDLAAYIEEVATSLSPRIKDTTHHLIVDCPPKIDMNSYPGALSQVLTNLVVNALVHAFDQRNQGTIRIEVTLISDLEVMMTVADDGAGIPSANLRKIFEPFFTTRRGIGGSGLGLHIVFNLVTQSLGGRITVNSMEGGGTAFQLRLPRDAPSRTDRTTLSDQALIDAEGQ